MTVRIWAVLVLTAWGWHTANANTVTNAQKQLNQTQSDLNQAINDRDNAKGQATTLTRELTKIRQNSITIARQIQQAESDLSHYESHLKSLKQSEREQQQKFKLQTERLTHLLGALEKLSRNPNTAFFLHPGTPTDAVRSSMVLSHMTQQLNTQAQQVRDDLLALENTRQQAEQRESDIRTALASLSGKQAQLTTLSARKKNQYKQAIVLSKRKQATINSLSAKSKNLQDFIGKISRQQSAKPAPKKITPQRPKSGQKTAVYFPKAGGLTPPVRGKITERYQQRSELGQRATGIRIRTRANAQVVAPYDGAVVFTGTYQKYGNMIIIKHVGGYYSVLAGIDKPDVFNGQQLYAGEPIGIMGGSTPELYLEIRKQSNPRNPLNWISVKSILRTG